MLRSRKLIVGCGYLGERVARLWQAAGHEIVAVTRTAARAATFLGRGWRPYLADVTCADSLRGLPDVDSVLWSVGFDRTSGHSLTEVYVSGLRHLLDQLPETVQKFTYISSTGVYGNAAGEWVDERTPCAPDREGGRACWAAEQMLNSHPRHTPTLILRMAGLYGPGRVPRQADLLARRLTTADARGYLNLVHIDDAAHVVVCAEQHARLPNLFVVSDGHPVLRSDYYQEVARQHGEEGRVPWCEMGEGTPPADVTTSPAGQESGRARSRCNSKRLRTDKLRLELPVQFRYPTYRDGLQAILGRASG